MKESKIRAKTGKRAVEKVFHLRLVIDAIRFRFAATRVRVSRTLINDFCVIVHLKTWPCNNILSSKCNHHEILPHERKERKINGKSNTNELLNRKRKVEKCCRSIPFRVRSNMEKISAKKKKIIGKSSKQAHAIRCYHVQHCCSFVQHCINCFRYSNSVLLPSFIHAIFFFLPALSPSLPLL